jgi:hypothetical protein
MSDYTLEWHGEAMTAEIEAAARMALLEAASDLQQESSDEAPVDTGDLRGDAKVDKSDLQNFIVRVGYALPYALRQHEEVGYNHPMGGKAKFLEDPFRRNAQKYIDHIGKRIAQAIK